MQYRIAAAGATFVAVTPQTAAKSRELVAERGVTFPVLTDFGNVYARQYNVLNELPDELIERYKGWGIDLAAWNGESSWALPIPGTYVIDTGGTIRYASAHPNYMMRPEPEDDDRGAGVAAMKAVAEIQVVPIGVGVSVRAQVRRAQDVIAESGLVVQEHSFGTNVEGELDAILAVVARIHEVLHAEGTARVSSSIKIGTRTDKDPDLASKLR